MATGTVKGFSDEKGYGFIAPMTAGRTCSFITPRSPATASGSLAEGARVSYDTEQSTKGRAAANVRVL
jgi:CspA family cold shock protein